MTSPLLPSQIEAELRTVDAGRPAERWLPMTSQVRTPVPPTSIDTWQVAFEQLAAREGCQTQSSVTSPVATEPPSRRIATAQVRRPPSTSTGAHITSAVRR